MINTEKAYNLIKKNIFCIKKTNKVNIKKSIGLYLAEDIKSTINIPPQDNSAVDGFAINFSNHKKNLNKVYDIVYEPALTPLMKLAMDNKLQNTNGFYMLVRQAAESFYRWFGIMPEDSHINEIIKILKK